ncbi:hypothetical protein [Persephonella sp. KM09-Lau-8]|uniref:hypothetical protein n=1 Tax=Persephonella sp. KM09-Lau-8 TaxID=1158345 RepID=UPI000494E1C1|nr:hypothetical protein [Persephonella sp. KM09-Lau-8]
MRKLSRSLENGKFSNREKGFVDLDILIFFIQLLAFISLIIGGLWVFKSYREGELKEDAVNMVIDLSEFYKKEYPQVEEEINFLETSILQAIEKADDRQELLRCLYMNKESIIKQSFCLDKKDIKDIRDLILKKINYKQ